mmetsp:Transcript_30259/g.81898  ORF Transcript_30259/g.81898 Transcript_30259/m.81898 type:complete len:206 (-) Transcript_30259:42-659(-)
MSFQGLARRTPPEPVSPTAQECLSGPSGCDLTAFSRSGSSRYAAGRPLTWVVSLRTSRRKVLRNRRLHMMARLSDLHFLPLWFMRSDTRYTELSSMTYSPWTFRKTPLHESIASVQLALTSSSRAGQAGQAHLAPAKSPEHDAMGTPGHTSSQRLAGRDDAKGARREWLSTTSPRDTMAASAQRVLAAAANIGGVRWISYRAAME